MMVLDAAVNHHKYIFVVEVGFNLAKTRHLGRIVIGQRATVQVPVKRGGNIYMRAAFSEDGVVGHYLDHTMLHTSLCFSIKLSRQAR